MRQRVRVLSVPGMAPTSTSQRDRLDEVIAELERARQQPQWVPPEPSGPRRLLRAPAALEQARWTPSRHAVIACTLIVLCALAVVGLRLLLMRQPAAQPSSLSTVKVAKASPVATGSNTASSVPGGTSASSQATPSSSSLRIHVVGQVRRPGVVTVPAGSRVSDAVAAAGGLTAAADPAAVNLARPLADGEQVFIAKPGETHTPPPDAVASSSDAAPTASAGAKSLGGAPTDSATKDTATTGGLVNLNTADLAALDSLPGVGPVLAQRIIDWRTEHQKFSSIDELNEVSGIGDKAMERLRSKVTV